MANQLPLSLTIVQSIITRLTRRKLIATGATSSLLLSLGCSSSPPAPMVVRFTYQEKIASILVAPQRSKLVVLGERYHYLFTDQKSLGKVVSASFAKDLVGSFGTFTVLPGEQITGTYRIRTRDSMTPNQRNEASQLGFIELPDGHFELTATITGDRFTTKPLPIDADPTTLNRTYSIDVTVLGDNNGSVAASSPIGRAADTVAEIFLTPVLVVMYLFLY